MLRKRGNDSVIRISTAVAPHPVTPCLRRIADLIQLQAIQNQVMSVLVTDPEKATRNRLIQPSSLHLQQISTHAGQADIGFAMRPYLFSRPAQVFLCIPVIIQLLMRSEEHTSELSHVAISYAVFCLKK